MTVIRGAARLVVDSSDSLLSQLPTACLPSCEGRFCAWIDCVRFRLWRWRGFCRPIRRCAET